MGWAHTMHRKYFYFNYNLFVWYHNPVHTLTSSASLHIWFLSSEFLLYAWIPRIFSPHWIIARTLYSGALFFHYPIFQEYFMPHSIISRTLYSGALFFHYPIFQEYFMPHWIISRTLYSGALFFHYPIFQELFMPHWIISRTLYSSALFFHYPVFQESFRSHLIISKDLVSRISILTVSILFLCLCSVHLFWSISQSLQNCSFHHFYYIWPIIQLIYFRIVSI
jgi:hypothetical protein